MRLFKLLHTMGSNLYSTYFNQIFIFSYRFDKYILPKYISRSTAGKHSFDTSLGDRYFGELHCFI